MIKAATAYTFEIDEPDWAVAEICRQIDDTLVLRKNTVGMIQCDPEFIGSGVVNRLCEALDFPVIGGTSAGQAVNAAEGDLMLTLMVLTSDDVEFVTAKTCGLADDLYAATAQSHASIKPTMMELPKLIVAFPPIIEALAGDAYVNAFERLFGRVPIFGSLAVDDAITVYDRCATIYQGEILSEEMVYLLMYGEVSPRFFIATVPDASALSETGVITQSEDNVVKQISGKRAIDFFEDMGLADAGLLRKGVDFVPFLMTVKGKDGIDERPFVRALIRFDERGSAICRGTMYENAEFTIGSNSGRDVIAATTDTIERINGEENANVALLFSCIVRRMTMGIDSKQELVKVRQTIRPDIPFMLSYSGGEIAPTAVGDDGAVNRFHNFSFIGCLL